MTLVLNVALVAVVAFSALKALLYDRKVVSVPGKAKGTARPYARPLGRLIDRLEASS